MPRTSRMRYRWKKNGGGSMLEFIATHIRINANGVGVSWAAACLGVALLWCVFAFNNRKQKGKKNG